jgi:hypothetical protein
MKAPIWKILAGLVIGLPLLTLGLIYLLRTARLPNLAEAICQPSDLGERYHPLNGPSPVIHPELRETVVESYTVKLIDHQLSYTMLDCQIYRFEDELVAKRAFEEVCLNQADPELKVGDETCAFAGYAPHNLAFRRNKYLVLMSGDVGFFPAKAVDERLR